MPERERRDRSEFSVVVALVLIGVGVGAALITALASVFTSSPVASAVFTILIIILCVSFTLIYRRDTSQLQRHYMSGMREIVRLQDTRRYDGQVIDVPARPVQHSEQLPAPRLPSLDELSTWVRTDGGMEKINLGKLSRLIDVYPVTSRSQLDGLVKGNEDHTRLIAAARGLGWVSEGGKGKKTTWLISPDQAREHLTRLTTEAIAEYSRPAALPQRRPWAA